MQLKKQGQPLLAAALALPGIVLPASEAGAERPPGAGEVGLRYQVVTKAKLPVVQAESVVRDRQAEVDFMRTATGVLRAIGAGAFWPTRGWVCGQCPYAAACTGSSGRGSR